MRITRYSISCFMLENEKRALKHLSDTNFDKTIFKYIFSFKIGNSVGNQKGVDRDMVY